MGRALAGLFAGAITATLTFGHCHAQGPGSDAVVGTKGECEEITLASLASECFRPNSVMYMHFRNGRTLFNVPLSDSRVIAFVGEKDSQPRLEEYHLYLSRIRIASKGTEFIANVAGECIAQISRDGRVWHRIDCHSTDENGKSYALRFKGDGVVASAGLTDTTVDPKVIALVTELFKTNFLVSGMAGVSKSVQKCYDDAGTKKIEAIKVCMLYDTSHFKLDRMMRTVFAMRGLPSAPANTYLSDRAFGLRMQIYSSLAFGGSPAEANKYFGDAPDKIVQRVMPN